MTRCGSSAKLVWQIPPGTPFAQLPEHWTCPNCDTPKDGFTVLEEKLD